MIWSFLLTELFDFLSYFYISHLVVLPQLSVSHNCIGVMTPFSVSVFASQEPGGRGCVTKTMVSHSADMLSKLRSQREAGQFCDITLRTDGRSYAAHRAVLAAVSDHFQEIFTEMDSNIKSDIDLTGKI